MIKNIIDLLNIDDFIDDSYNIQVAKGLYNYDSNLKAIKIQKERIRILKQRLKENSNE
jgi:hypothetical protein